ncbi:ricin-type beta-trefoil lectin domain protein [Actinobacillus equuli subsp. equuli]|uniref:ricin-type beta-trefoil lectin domain protein n=1 Tax=Actinobacillus equuli TaxID=718 RepID=UPI0024436499|nr:ricin-type beta-trefoil lectin domain protein [Actinobacillus equuli]WGE54421.1 ricin-type beta-trefoil lectin domain protein [Actinobacillus equuli subsp. equuli]
MKKVALLATLVLSACVYVVPPTDVGGGYPVSNPNVIIIPSHQPNSQQGYPHLPHSGLIKTASGKCLDQSGSDYRGIIAYHCHGKANQRFEFVNSQIKVNGQCLDVGGEYQYNGAKVITYRCHGGENQQWFRDGQQIRSSMSGKCLDIGKRGNKLAIYQCDGSRGQQFFY